jgi:alkylated DNA repair protein (DNA oxidative demethylase)
MSALFPRERREVAPGALHIPGWLDDAQQAGLLAQCRAWARPPAGLETVVLPGGGVMSVRSVSLGLTWQPYHYVPVTAAGEPVKPFPDWLGALGRRAVAEAYGPTAGEAYAPDMALVNFYDDQARMGLHQDRYEAGSEPVVSLSLGDTCVFRLGNTETRTRPWTDLELESGDLFVFGGPSRFAYHGVPKTYPGTGPAGLGLKGRLNITIRVSGLARPPQIE